MLQRKIGLCVLRERDSHGDDQDPFRIMNGMEGGRYGILRYFLDQKFRVDRSISKRFFISNQGNLSPKTGKLLIAQFFFPNLPPTIDPLTSFYGRAGGQITFNLPKNHFFRVYVDGDTQNYILLDCSTYSLRSITPRYLNPRPLHTDLQR